MAKKTVTEFADFINNINLSIENQSRVEEFLDFVHDEIELAKWINRFDTEDHRRILMSNAIDRQDLQAIEGMLEVGFNINCFLFDDKFRTPLINAAENGHVEIVRFLLDRGANINLNRGTNISCRLRFCYTALYTLLLKMDIIRWLKYF